MEYFARTIKRFFLNAPFPCLEEDADTGGKGFSNSILHDLRILESCPVSRCAVALLTLPAIPVKN